MTSGFENIIGDGLFDSLSEADFDQRLGGWGWVWTRSVRKKKKKNPPGFTLVIW